MGAALLGAGHTVKRVQWYTLFYEPALVWLKYSKNIPKLVRETHTLTIPHIYIPGTWY